ncbi:MAG: hypothetical protein HQL69_14560 [Magnetococcales bacterium]|nr:hypothetical protein [Magnetococcales bacterium]
MNENIRVLLLTSMSERGVNMTPPIGLHRLRFYLAQRGISCDVVDFAIEDSDKSLLDVKRGLYHIIGIQVTHFQIITDLELLWLYKDASRQCRHNVLMIAGGQEATMNHKQWLEVGIDLIGLGFAEKVMYEIASIMATHITDAGPKAPIDVGQLFGELNGVAFLDNHGQAVYRPAQHMDEDEFRQLNYNQVKKMDIPHLEYWELVRAQRADLFVTGERRYTYETVRLYTSSHCPRRCGFCSSQNFFPISLGQKSPILMLTASEVFDLIIYHIETYGAKAFLFTDDDFAVGNRSGLERFKNLCNIIIAGKKSGQIPAELRFIFQARIADFLIRTNDTKKQHEINFELLDLISTAGFRNVGLGVETFSENLLFAPSINKRVTSKACHDVINAMLKRKMVPQIYIIIGIPESSCEELVDSMDAAIDYMDKGCDVGMVTQLRAYPGSPLVQNPEYKIAYKSWQHPDTGKIHKFMDYFIPGDPVMKVVAANIKEEALVELEKAVSDNNLDDTTIWPKSLIGVTAFMAAARLLNRMDVYNRYESYLDRSISMTN